MITAKVIADSTANGVRLTTLELVYPRFIHSEFMTHRAFSRNASSSRAIPVKKMLAMIRENPAIPVHWGQNQAGMQAGEEIADPELARNLWLEACESAVQMAEKMLALNLHKQIVNRITEPFAHIKVLVTATEWENFFTLRDHKDAQPEIRALAIEMKKAMAESIPCMLHYDDWHLPFISDEEKKTYRTGVLLKISTARCARVSYLNHDGSAPDIAKDIDLYDKLITAKPIHASPTEHQATPVKLGEAYWNGNFRAWKQHRKIIEVTSI